MIPGRENALKENKTREAEREGIQVVWAGAVMAEWTKDAARTARHLEGQGSGG